MPPARVANNISVANPHAGTLQHRAIPRLRDASARHDVSEGPRPSEAWRAPPIVGAALSSASGALAPATIEQFGPRLRRWMPRRSPSSLPAIPGTLRVGDATEAAEPTEADIAGVAAGPRPADAPLTGSERRRLEGIRVHTGPLAAASADAVGAAAYAVGNHVAFASARYAPSTRGGRLLLAHELIHAVGPPEAVVRREQIGPPTLIETYRVAVREGRWSDAAEILNGFNRLDIEIQLAALTGDQVALLHAGTLGNPRVGPDSQLAQMTDPNAPRASTAPPMPAATSPVVARPAPAATTLSIPAGTASVTTIAAGTGVADLSADAATQQRLMQIIQTGGPMPVGSRARVIGAAIVDIDGFAGAHEIRAISSSETDALGVGAPVFHATTPATRTITAARSIGGSRGEFPFSHVNDAEIKMFEYIAANMPPNATGRISILTVRSRDSGQSLEPIPACSSCTNALFQLAGQYRGVQVGSYAPVRSTGTVDLRSGGAGSSGGPENEVDTTRGTTAQIGTPDLRGLDVGGPSPRGVAIGAGIQLAFMGANFVLNRINDSVQEGRARGELAAIEPAINAARQRDPSAGVLLVFFYSQVQAPDDSIMRPGAVFGHIEFELGHTRDEAFATWIATPALRQGYASNVNELTQEIWIPPSAPASPALLRTPFRTSGLGRFAANRTILQDVEWGGLTGFDDEGTTSLSNAASARFLVLSVPQRLFFYNGTIRSDVDIPVEQRPPHAGPAIPTVNLDPRMPRYDVHAAALFPVDDDTDALFATAPATRDNLGQLDHYTNFGKVRWARPENLDIDG
jgi:hypothetical protein